jgi:integrase
VRQHLTDLTVRALPHPDSGDVKYWDEVVPGFGVRVTARSKSWFVVRGKQRQLTTIGKYPVISLAEARKTAKRLLVQDPVKNGSMGISEAVAAYLADCSTRLRPRTVEEYARPLLKVTTGTLATFQKPDITDPHTIMAWKVFFNWCMRQELVDKNPYQYATITTQQRSRVLTNEEIKQLWAYDYPPFSDYLKLLILTGQRRSQFTDYEIRDDTLFFPARIMKGKQDHTIPLLSLARQYIDRLKPFNGWSKAKARIDEKTGVTGWVVHDCRRSFSTIMASLRTPIHVTEKILDHRTGAISGVASIYNRHSYLEEAREALLTYETHIAKLVGA